MLKSKSQNSKPSKAQRSAQSSRDKKLAQARMGASSSSRPQKKSGQRRANLGGVPPIAGFFAPVAEGTIMKSVKPIFQRSSHERQRIIHREKIAKLTTPGTGTFTVLGSFPLNPGSPQTFPWLSNEAAGWESYKFNRVRFLWVPTSGTSVAGNIIMAPDYDASDAAPASETNMSSYSDCEEGNVWCRFAADLEKGLLNSNLMHKYVRLGALSANQDIKMYDSGNFFVASADDAAANSGKLWVEYDVELLNPQVPPGGFQSSGSLQSGGGSLTSAVPFGVTPVSLGPLALSNTGLSNVVTIGNVQVGQEVAIAYNLTGTGISSATFGSLTGLTLKSGNAVFPASAISALGVATFTVTAPSPSFTVSTASTTITAAFLTAAVLAPIPAF